LSEETWKVASPVVTGLVGAVKQRTPLGIHLAGGALVVVSAAVVAAAMFPEVPARLVVVAIALAGFAAAARNPWASVDEPVETT
jgi:hypothetical protein